MMREHMIALLMAFVMMTACAAAEGNLLMKTESLCVFVKRTEKTGIVGLNCGSITVRRCRQTGSMQWQRRCSRIC